MEKKESSRIILWRNTAIISGLLTIIAPLFGLLGTVFGMVDAFDTMEVEGNGDPERLAGDISLALITTAGGIIIAVPSFIVFVVSLILMIRARSRQPALPDS